jgi:Tol biopolymer transport system component
MKKTALLCLIAIPVMIITACSSTPTALPSPSATATLTQIPATATPTSSPTPEPTPTLFPFDTLPGWHAYMNFDCPGYGICTAISIVRPDVSGHRMISDHEDGLAMEPVWSPDGRYIAYTLAQLHGDPILIVVFDFVEDRSMIVYQHPTMFPYDLAWSSDSRYILFSGMQEDQTTSTIVRLDIASGATTVLVEWPGFQAVDAAYAPDGSRIVFASNKPEREAANSNIWLMEPDGSDPEQITSSSSATNWQYTLPSWSPDGETIACIRQSPEDAAEPSSALCFIEAQGTEWTCFKPFDHPMGTDRPAWSPDGQYLIFALGDGEESGDIYLLDISDGGIMVLNDTSGKFYSISWAPDSSAAVFMQRKAESDRVVHLLIVNQGDPFKYDSGGTSIDNIMWSPVGEIP